MVDSISVFSHTIFWLWVAGLVTLAAGILARRIHPLLFAAPLVVFGAEHLTSARAIAGAVPAWMPWRMFWVYFVGVALICAGLSIALKIYDRLSATLAGIMFVCFVAMIHIPNVVTAPRDRIIWAVALRDLSFAGGAFALAQGKALRPVVRMFVGVPLIFFAVEHFLHPQFAPGVPLPKMTPDWVPIRAFWGYLTGLALLVAGAMMLVNSGKARVTAMAVGWLMVGLTLFLYLPIFLTAPPAGMLEGINYVADTLLFGGAVMAAAGAWPRNGA